MTKEIINEYLQEVNEKIWANDKRMQEFIRKECSDVFKSNGGFYVCFDKPRIQKDFCFGAGQNGLSTDEDWEIAYSNAKNARTNEKYFLKRNLEQFEEMMEMLSSPKKLYLMQNYYKPSKIACVRSEEYFARYEWDRNKIVEELSQSDIEKLKQIVISEKEKFIKRLNTYLKRYGLTKINSWTYLVD